MKAIGLYKDGIFFRLLYGVAIVCFLAIIGSIAGIILGILAGAISAYLYSAFDPYTVQAIYGKEPFDNFVTTQIDIIGMPIGFLLGLVTGLHHAIFRLFIRKSLLWVIIAGLGTLAGFWFSGYGAGMKDLRGFILEVVFVGILIAGLIHILVFIITHQVFKIENKLPNQEILVVSSITGFLLVFISVYEYFIFLLYLQSIPS